MAMRYSADKIWLEKIKHHRVLRRTHQPFTFSASVDEYPLLSGLALVILRQCPRPLSLFFNITSIQTR